MALGPADNLWVTLNFVRSNLDSMADEQREMSRSVAGQRLQQLYDENHDETHVPVSFENLREAAREQLPDDVFAYVDGGAGSEDTMDENRAAFRRWRIVHRVLRDVSERSLETELFGRKFAAPILLAPVASQTLYDDEGEVATARAASSLDVPIVLSSGSSRNLESVAEAMGDTPRWFQLYWSSDRELCASLVERAQAAGFDAIVLTVDSQVPGWRERLLERAYQPVYDDIDVANYTTDSVFQSRLPDDPDPETILEHYAEVARDPTLTWNEIEFLQSETDLPIIIKGIVHPDDAERAVEADLDGIVVSNHGGRQLDGAVATLDALPGVVDAVDGAIPVLLDSGIRRGTDVLKALALGASGVFVGRPYVYGLALAGEDGVRQVVGNMMASFDLALAQSGYVAPEQLSEDALVEAHT